MLKVYPSSIQLNKYRACCPLTLQNFCYTNNQIVLGKKEEMILIRVYGHNSELMIDRRSEIRNMMLLHANDCGSELYASFQNGLAYQFLAGSTLTMESVMDPLIFPLVAKACAKMHSIRIPGKI